jgi:NADPH-dependent 2,4-dienoyl-CoA reductase/sulfur reductase-like enzyme
VLRYPNQNDLPPSSGTRVLIVGAGLAGARCAETLRAEGFEGQIAIAGEEPVAPYERPALSKELLAGTRGPESLALRPSSTWQDKEIELLTGTRIAGLEGHTAHTTDGRTLPWDALVIATGAAARRLGPGRHRLRTLADAAALQTALRSGRSLTVVGTGLVGTEVASTARALGIEVTLVGDAPLGRLLGPEVSALVAERQRAHGIRLAPRGTPTSGIVLDAVGAGPATRWLRGSVPLRADGSVIADACGRTPVPEIYACGDATGTGHWTAAAGQAAAAARAILGAERPYEDVPYFWSDQLGLRLQHVGDSRAAASVELDGDLDSLRARYLDRSGRLVGALLVNRPHEVGELRRALASTSWDRVAA